MAASLNACSGNTPIGPDGNCSGSGNHGEYRVCLLLPAPVKPAKGVREEAVRGFLMWGTNHKGTAVPLLTMYVTGVDPVLHQGITAIRIAVIRIPVIAITAALIQVIA